MSGCSVMYLGHRLHMFLGLMSAQAINGSIKQLSYLTSRWKTLESTNVKQATPMEMIAEALLYIFRVGFGTFRI